MAGDGIAVKAIADGTKLTVGRGRLFIDVLNTAGATQGALFAGTVDELSITPSSDFIEKRSMIDPTNSLLSRVETTRTMELNITAAEWKKEVLGLGLDATVAEYTQAATPVVDETWTISSKKDRWYFPPNGQRKIGSVTVKVSPSTVKTEGTDYVYDIETGGIYIIPAGSIADGSTLLMSYTPTLLSAGSGITQLNIGAAGTQLAEVRFVADPLVGAIHELLLYKVHFAASDLVSFLGQEYGTVSLKGLLLEPVTKKYAGSKYGVTFQR